MQRQQPHQEVMAVSAQPRRECERVRFADRVSSWVVEACLLCVWCAMDDTGGQDRARMKAGVCKF